MAQNEPQRKDTPPGPSPNSPPLLFEYQCRSGKFIRLVNRIETFLPELECSTAQMSRFSDDFPFNSYSLQYASNVICHFSFLDYFQLADN